MQSTAAPLSNGHSVVNYHDQRRVPSRNPLTMLQARRIVSSRAQDLLAEAAAAGDDLASMAHVLLARLAQLTGLSSTYFAETRLDEDEQRILFSYNSSDVFHIPEDITLPWSEGVCRFVVEGGPNYTTDAQRVFPKSGVARLLEIRTFVSYPVFASNGRFFGTLCGASKDVVEIEDELLGLMRECARLLGARIPTPEAGTSAG
jgi:diguanylate cyclase